jgi:hypothetical protein
MLQQIREQFKKHKISQMQLDPFGVCNARCWFCPVKYRGNPAEGKETMSSELLEKIISNIIGERNKPDGLVSKKFNGFYTAHYNEILLYKYFDKFLEICRKYKLVSLILSNGVALTPDKVDLIKNYPDVLSGICLNIPAFEAEVWSKRSGFSEKQFETLVSNIRYVVEKLPNMVANKAFSIQINCVHKLSLIENGGWLEKGEEFPDIDLDIEKGELKLQEKKARELFPRVNIFTVPYLIDRAGTLNNVMSNKSSIERHRRSRNVVECGNGREVGGRPIGWVHINAAGNAFLCCNDFNFDFKFGNFKTQQLSDFWGKDEHIDKIEQSYKTICLNCASAVYQ